MTCFLGHLEQEIGNLSKQIHQMQNQRIKHTTAIPPIIHRLQHKIDNMVNEIGTTYILVSVLVIL